jgi:thiol reductant ABC exporter CydC subunit
VSRSAPGTLRRLAAVSPPPWGRLSGAIALAVGAAGASVALLAGSGALVDKAATRPGLGAIAGLLAGVEVIAFLRAPLRYAERLVAHDAGLRALTRWRVWLFDRLEPLLPAPLQRWRSGDLARRLIADVDGLQDLYLRGLGPLVAAVVAAAGAVVVEGVLVPAAAAVLGACLLVALLGAPALAWAGRQTDADRAAAGTLTADLVDLVHGAAELVAFGRSADQLARIDQGADQLDRAARRRSRALGAADALVGLCAAVATTGALALGVAAVVGHRLEPIMLAVLPLVALGVFEVVPSLAAAAVGAAELQASGRRLLQLADLEPPVSKPEDPWPVPPGPAEVALRNVRLRYQPDQQPALDGLNLVLAPGSRTALVGPSGSGKTSVLHALLRFWPLEAGRIELGGTPVDQLAPSSVRAQFATVVEDGHLFAGTIAENVRLARPDATDDDVHAALTLAQLDGWVAELPLGLDTPVGEHGSRLSGGQRQRVALARALVADRPVLLLDEPGGGLDPSSADRLLADVLEAARGRTVLVISHRLEGTEAFDAVAELSAGRLVAFRPGAPGPPPAHPATRDGTAL